MYEKNLDEQKCDSMPLNNKSTTRQKTKKIFVDLIEHCHIVLAMHKKI